MYCERCDKLSFDKCHCKKIGYFIPTKQQIQDLKIGDLAPNSLSKDWQPITEIFARQQNVSGKWFICYYTKLGENSTISHSLVEDKLDRTVGLINNYTSHELDVIEKQMLARRVQCHSTNNL